MSDAAFTGPTAVEIAAGVRSGSLKAVDVLEQHLARVHRPVRPDVRGAGAHDHHHVIHRRRPEAAAAHGDLLAPGRHRRHDIQVIQVEVPRRRSGRGGRGVRGHLGDPHPRQWREPAGREQEQVALVIRLQATRGDGLP